SGLGRVGELAQQVRKLVGLRHVLDLDDHPAVLGGCVFLADSEGAAFVGGSHEVDVVRNYQLVAVGQSQDSHITFDDVQQRVTSILVHAAVLIDHQQERI